MGSNRSPRTAITVLVCALALTGCSRYDDNVLVENRLDVPIVVLTTTDPSLQGEPEAFERLATDPGDNTSLYVRWPEPDPPWHLWPLSELVDPPCREDLSLVAFLKDGHTIVREPPLCPAELWTVRD